MPFQVTIKPSERVYTSDEDETILESALREGITLPYGCRNGACGTCKGRLLEGELDYGVYQESALSITEKRDGYALFCQAKPLSDVVIEAREIAAAKDIKIRILPCRVEKIDRISHDVIILQLKLPANDRFQFLAGQYIQFILKEGKKRAFSLANAPHQNQFLELHVRYVPGGKFCEYVFHELKEKAILRFEGPLGSFFLREDSDKPIIFMAGGTGFAPIKGVIEHAFHVGIDRPMVLYWGARSLRDLYMPHLPAQWQQEHKNFTFIPVLSEPLAEDNWPGRTGFVHQAILDDFDDLSGYQVYACGAPPMVALGFKTFMEQGLPPDEYFSDPFEFSHDSAPSEKKNVEEEVRP